VGSDEDDLEESATEAEPSSEENESEADEDEDGAAPTTVRIYCIVAPTPFLGSTLESCGRVR